MKKIFLALKLLLIIVVSEIVARFLGSSENANLLSFFLGMVLTMVFIDFTEFTKSNKDK